jgi:Na+-translocating ferredoxin:NAD+ oxidoreductase RnfA subunit
MDILSLLPVFIMVSIALVVVFTELIKRLDKKDRLKGYRVYIPLAFSFGAAALLRIGNFFVSEQMWFWWAVIFGFSVFAYEAILKKLESAFTKNG